MSTARDYYSSLKLDDSGLLIDAKEWNEKSAMVIADHLGITSLTDAHWKVIYTLRVHYDRFGVAPAMFNVCRTNGEDSDWVHNLFNTCLDAWRVAGLPDPGEEAKSYLSDM